MLVTAAVSQSAIGPYVAVAVVGLVTHAITAVFKFVSVMAVCAATCAGRKRSSARPTRRCDRHATAHLHKGDTACCTAVRHAATRCMLHRRATKNTKLQPQGMTGGKGHRNTETLPQHTNIVVQSTLGCIVNFNNSVEQGAARNNLFIHLHEVRDSRLVSGHGDAFADRRRRSGGSRTHRVD